MSDGSEFHTSDAATGKEHRPTVVNQNGTVRGSESSPQITVPFIPRSSVQKQVKTRIPSGIWSRLYGSFPSALNTLGATKYTWPKV